MIPYRNVVGSHLKRLTSSAKDRVGDLWPSVLDVRTGDYPEGAHSPRRVYRLIGAPRGSTLYWDQPMVVAATLLSHRMGTPEYGESADRYIKAFLNRCVAENGMFRWGNHAYFDVYDQNVVEFHGGPHELRPITPAWDLFYRLDPEATSAYIREMARRHVYDPATGGFNRHDDRKKGHAFLEAGGILSESLAWLYGKTGDANLLRQALNIARYSYRHRDPSTGLLPNEPDHGRWDSRVSTSETGLWTQCLLRAHRYSRQNEFYEMAHAAARTWITHAYDPGTGRFLGQLDLRTGKSVVPETPGYWPGKFSDPWSTDQWPTHDYPMSLAETCLSLFGDTGDRVFREAVHHWADLAVETAPVHTGKAAYAESYGRCIHFLTRAGIETGEPHFLTEAEKLANDAMDRLYSQGMFTGLPGENLYEAVDGVGYLCLALLYLETRQPMDLKGFGF